MTMHTDADVLEKALSLAGPRARVGRDPLRELVVLGAQRDIAPCGVARCEVARGIRDETILDKFRHFDSIPGIRDVKEIM